MDLLSEATELECWLDQLGIKDGTLLERVKRIANVPNHAQEPLQSEPSSLKLSADQEAAMNKIRLWLASPQPYFVLRGFAGSGKTTLMRVLNSQHRGIYFSATTNKAAKVLGSAVDKIAKTTYSLLGLRMVEDDDKLVLRQADHPPHFPANAVIVIDEASMVSHELMQAVDNARKRCGIKILYVGDPAQLPPVGEPRSPAWRCTNDPACRSILKQVMRNDNELLTLATRIRRRIREQDWRFPIRRDMSITNGEFRGVVMRKSREEFIETMLDEVPTHDLRETKVIAWRNKTVNEYNKLIRRKLGFNDPFCIGDIVLLAEPIEYNGNLIAHTDDEFVVEGVDDDSLDIDTDSGKMGIATWRLSVAGDQRLQLQIPQKPFILQEQLSAKAFVARRAKGHERAELWRDFWDTKRRFHAVRYGYAMTAHRAQGSTYNTVWVDAQDILANHDSHEAFRCLYVACTRPTTLLHSY